MDEKLRDGSYAIPFLYSCQDLMPVNGEIHVYTFFMHFYIGYKV